VEGDFETMQDLAARVHCSRSTASRFFNGRSASLSMTLKILAALKLEFTDVAAPATGANESSI